MKHYPNCELVTFRTSMLGHGLVLNAFDWQVVLGTTYPMMCWCSQRLGNEKWDPTPLQFDQMFQNFARFCANNFSMTPRRRGKTVETIRRNLKLDEMKESRGQVIEVDFRNRRRL